jgi:hypothetical protein
MSGCGVHASRTVLPPPTSQETSGFADERVLRVRMLCTCLYAVNVGKSSIWPCCSIETASLCRICVITVTTALQLARAEQSILASPRQPNGALSEAARL